MGTERELNNGTMSEDKVEVVRRLGAAINRLSSSIQDLERFADLDGVQLTIQFLIRLRLHLSEQQDCLSSEIEKSKEKTNEVP